ncbi:Rx, N-terminal [Dillenia turbinata]|uniref:Rx, N-terminal n=1 Tax=Dillenia turbinata TaxID=194707 RepID=A0AAN8ZDF9_9MAGN
MGDPLLAAHLQSLLDKLARRLLMDFPNQEGFDSELRKWRSMLRKIKPVLGDAEEKQMNDKEVKRWLDDLLVLAYDADDALDDLDCEALEQQNNSPSDPATSSSQLLDMLPALIKKITARFLDIEEQKSDLGLEAKHGVQSSIINKRSETTSFLDTSEIVGREQDVEAILKLMRLSETTKAEARASPTLGIAGRSWGDAGIYSLAGGLRISMDKVKDEEDAHVMDLMNMKNVQELEFNWGENWKAESQVQILNLLGTGKMLRNLVIRGYCGVTLPNWIGDSSYSNELYGEASSHGQPFPSLTELCIARCENLRTLPDGIMSSNSILQVLEIEDCQSLESFGSGVLPSTLKKLSLRYLSSLPEGGLPHGLQDFEFGPCAKVEKQIWDELAPHKLPFLTRLCINGVLWCEGIESFPFLETPNLTHLQIRRCRNLKYLPSNLPKLTSLLYLCVVRCHNLVSLPEGGLPPGLQDFEFRACAKEAPIVNVSENGLSITIRSLKTLTGDHF